MLTVHPPKAILKSCTQVPPFSITPRHLSSNTVAFDAHVKNCNQRSLSASCSWESCSQFRRSYLPRLPNQSALNRWLCQSRKYDSPDDEFRSSRNIAISLFRRYRNVIDRGGCDNLKDFISAGVNAYALGCTDEGLRNELVDMKDSGADIEGIENHGGITPLKSMILSKEVDECILWLSIIFITILCTPQPTVVRWSSTTTTTIPVVSNEMMLNWKGFCGVIANAYYVKGMAWLPVKTLQLEQMAVVGCAEEASVVASRMQLVFTTLEVVSPQWPNHP